MIELGLGALEVLSAGGKGTVVATFAKAAYLRYPAGLVALTTAEVSSGPLHARGAYPIHRLGVELEGARVWRGPVPEPARLVAGSDLALDVLGAAPPSALMDRAYRRRVASAATHLHSGDLDGVVGALGGLGPGLTPSGDDTIAGILLVARAMRGPAAEPSLVRIAAGARTNDIARSFLAWAARGQSIEPVHRLLTAAADDDRVGAAAAVGALLVFGHSSGADLAFGLQLGLDAFCCSTTVNAV